MSSPAPPPTFVPPPPNAAFGNTPGGFWPEVSFDSEQSGQTSRPEQPYFKKPKLSEDNPNVIVPNHNTAPRMPPPARGQGKLFFKTRHCEKFREGTCPYGSNCNFAHGEEDLRKPPPNWQEIVGFHVGGGDKMDRWDEDMSIINRHRLCKNFFSGRACPYGERCNYRHEDPGKFRESAVININTTQIPMDNGVRSVQSDNVVTVGFNHDATRMNSKPVTWKTRMCHKWMETLGNCPFGDKCHFAHGQEELKKFTGHYEVVTGNVNTAPPKPLPNPNSSGDAFLSGTVEGGSSKPVLSKFLSKWKGPEKINRIYADWIDDLHLTKSSPSKFDN